MSTALRVAAPACVELLARRILWGPQVGRPMPGRTALAVVWRLATRRAWATCSRLRMTRRDSPKAVVRQARLRRSGVLREACHAP